MKASDFILKITPYFFRNHLFENRPDNTKNQYKVNNSEYVFEFPADIDNLKKSDLSDLSLDLKAVDSLKNSGDLVGLVFFKGRIVHRSFVQIHGIARMEGDRNAFTLSENESYIHSCLTVKEHRGKGLYPAMLNLISVVLNSERRGHYKVFIACRKKNQASIKGILQAGYHYVKSSAIIGALSGIIRIRLWYIDSDLKGR